MDSIKAKSKGRAIGFSLVMIGIYFLNSILVGIVYGALLGVGIIGNNIDIQTYMENNSTSFLATVSILSIIVFGIILYFKQKSSKNYSDKPFVSFGKVKKEELSESFILFLGMYGITMLWVVLINLLSENNLFFQKILESHNNIMGEITSSESFILVFFATAIIAPVIEELFFRGLIYGRLRQAMKPIVAIFISSLLFGIFHGNIVQGVYAFFIGFVLALVYEKTGALWLSIVGHALINTIGVVIPYLKLESLQIALIIIGIIALIPSILILKKWFTTNEDILTNEVL